MVSARQAKKHAQHVLERLAIAYPDAVCALNHSTPLQLLIATILSAQCTDQRVNLVTPALFNRFPTAQAFAAGPLSEIEQLVQSTGFFRNKAKNIQLCCRAIVERHNGKVPKDLDSLVALAGVGRKTANVLLGTAFGIPSGVVVDTHVGRISIRLGLTKQTDPVRAERDLMAIIPQSEWINYSHRLIHHGRQVCLARKPRCEICTLADICPKVGVNPPKPASKAKPQRGATGSGGRKDRGSKPTESTAVRTSGKPRGS
ncbi:MAG: endonuclease III [Planctomycetota bacterium]|nr:endonuclease III [Planctomycetota bacterium]